MIGLFGGTFDPVHYGHLRPALEILTAMNLDEMRFIPAAQPPHRPAPQASIVQRREMLELALAEQPGFVLDDREFRRAGPSYMIDTLVSLRAELGSSRPLCLVLGLDAFSGLNSWHRWQELLDQVHIVIAQRPAMDQQTAIPDSLQILLREHLTEQLSQLETRPAGCLYRVEVTQLAISASMIRADCASARSCRYLLPETVYEYIKHTDLYKS